MPVVQWVGRIPLEDDGSYGSGLHQGKTDALQFLVLCRCPRGTDDECNSWPSLGPLGLSFSSGSQGWPRRANFGPRFSRWHISTTIVMGTNLALIIKHTRWTALSLAVLLRLMLSSCTTHGTRNITSRTVTALIHIVFQGRLTRRSFVCQSPP